MNAIAQELTVLAESFRLRGHDGVAIVLRHLAKCSDHQIRVCVGGHHERGKPEVRLKLGVSL